LNSSGLSNPEEESDEDGIGKISDIKKKNRRRNSISAFFGKNSAIKNKRSNGVSEGDTKYFKLPETTVNKIEGYIMEYSNPSLFHEIIVSPSMYRNHMPNRYEDALESYVQYLIDIDLKTKSQLNTTTTITTTNPSPLSASAPSSTITSSVVCIADNSTFAGHLSTGSMSILPSPNN